MKPKAALLQNLSYLRDYLLENAPAWQEAKDLAARKNSWFIPESIELAVKHIARQYLEPKSLEEWLAGYNCTPTPRTIGIVMAGNIPLVGFHDFLCGYLSGHALRIKLSSKDDVLLPHLLQVLEKHDEELATRIQVVERLTGCDAYIATGSDNSARYFAHYFGNKPHLIRRARTSVAVLDGTETTEELKALETDIFDYFGLGCRNITQLYVPEGYDFEPFLRVIQGPEAIVRNHKYRNNYDYQLAIYLLNRVPYLSNENLLLVENELPFSAVATLHYQHYSNREALMQNLRNDDRIQAVVSREEIAFGQAQHPALCNYADGVDTMAFLCSL